MRGVQRASARLRPRQRCGAVLAGCVRCSLGQRRICFAAPLKPLLAELPPHKQVRQQACADFSAQRGPRLALDFTVEYDKPFEQSYMRPLYEYGRERELRGDAWVKRPPI